MTRKTLIFVVALLVAGLSSGVSVLAAEQSTNITVNAQVQSVISITTSGSVLMNIVPGTGVSSGVDTVTVNTNSHNGYVLNLKATTSDRLVKGGDSIGPTSGSWLNPSTMSSDSWGYRIDNLGSFGGPTSTSYAKVTLAGQDVKTTSGHTTGGGDVTSVRYGAQVGVGQPSGDYTGQVTYTATTNS
ncbi:MAG: hypothetical protein ACOX0Z_00250 [Candidatus Nanosyncoccaceae bacterium]|jgi:hypothetical protein